MPTDIEVGRGGQLYVPSLPGGPEGDELGARGSIFTINPWSGRVRRVGREADSPHQLVDRVHDDQARVTVVSDAVVWVDRVGSRADVVAHEALSLRR